MVELQHWIEQIHQWVGFPLAFIVAPLALATFAGRRGHRRFGETYLYLMLFLYATGTFMTLTRHDWMTWEFARNVVFNFFGFSLLLYGWRAIHLYRRGGAAPAALDRGLALLLAGTAVALFAVAVWKNTPMRVFTLLAVALAVMEFRELRAPVLDRPLLFRRHARYILASYFYVLTVVSIVHLGDELPRNWKWLWPTTIGVAVVWLVSGSRTRWPVRWRPRLAKLSVWATLAVALAFGGYAMFDLARGGSRTPQADSEGPQGIPLLAGATLPAR